MKMVFYTASLGKGGAERVLTNLANYFSYQNDVTIILDYPIIDYKINDNVKIITLDNKPIRTNNFFSKKMRFVKYLFKLKKILKDINPEIIISFLAVPAFMSLLAKNKNSKIIVSVRNDPKTEYTTFLKRRLMLWLYPKANGFVFQTKDAENYFKNILTCKQTIIYNAVSSDFINYRQRSKKKKEIVAVGRLHWQKNYPLLIDAFEMISKKYDDYNLIIYGDGNEKQNLYDIIRNKNLSKRIILAGNVDDVKKYISSASLFVMTSDFEGMPNSLIEAMVLGLPVISTDCPCGGPRELIVSGENGLLINTGCKDELVNAICYVLDNEEFANKLGQEAKKIVNIVNPDYIYKKWDKFISEICK